MFGKKRKKRLENTTVIFWGTLGGKDLSRKIHVMISEIKPFKKKFGWIQNKPSSLGFVSDAMEVHGNVLDEDVEKKEVYFLVPEFEIDSYQPGEAALLWLNEKNYCFKIEKV